MGWSYRKSVNIGPFRINVSKSGIGYSVGSRGFRSGVSASGRTYVSMGIPGTGLRYTESRSRSKAGCLVLLALLGGAALPGVWLVFPI